MMRVQAQPGAFPLPASRAHPLAITRAPPPPPHTHPQAPHLICTSVSVGLPLRRGSSARASASGMDNRHRRRLASRFTAAQSALSAAASSLVRGSTPASSAPAATAAAGSMPGVALLLPPLLQSCRSHSASSPSTSSSASSPAAAPAAAAAPLSPAAAPPQPGAAAGPPMLRECMLSPARAGLARRAPSPGKSRTHPVKPTPSRLASARSSPPGPAAATSGTLAAGGAWGVVGGTVGGWLGGRGRVDGCVAAAQGGAHRVRFNPTRPPTPTPPSSHR